MLICIICNIRKFEVYVLCTMERYYFYVLTQSTEGYTSADMLVQTNLQLLASVACARAKPCYPIHYFSYHTHLQISTQFQCAGISDCAVQMLLSPFIGPLKCHYLHFLISNVPTYCCNISWYFRSWPLIPMEYQVIRITVMSIMA